MQMEHSSIACVQSGNAVTTCLLEQSAGFDPKKLDVSVTNFYQSSFEVRGLVAGRQFLVQNVALQPLQVDILIVRIQTLRLQKFGADRFVSAQTVAHYSGFYCVYEPKLMPQNLDTFQILISIYLAVGELRCHPDCCKTHRLWGFPTCRGSGFVGALCGVLPSSISHRLGRSE